MITVCPKYEADGETLSPLAGQAVVRNLPPGLYGVVAIPGADRIARGEEWLQTNTLDGGSRTIRSSRPVSRATSRNSARPASTWPSASPIPRSSTIESRESVPNRTDCTHTVKGKVTLAHMSRTPDERLYSSGTHDALRSPSPTSAWEIRTERTSRSPSARRWELHVHEHARRRLEHYRLRPVERSDRGWLSTPVRVGAASVVNMGEVAIHQWRQNLYTRTFFDQNGDGDLSRITNLGSRWCRPTSGSATAASRTSTTPT